MTEENAVDPIESTPEDDLLQDESPPPEDEAPPEDEESGEPEPQERRGKTARDRIVELARERAAERARADRLEAMLYQQHQMWAQQAGQTPETAPTVDPSQPPDPDQFPAGRFDPDYIEALTDFKTNAAVQAQIQHAQFVVRQQRLAQAEAEFAAQHQDYWSARETLLLDPVVASNPVIGQVIIESSNPPALIYHLCAHPDVAHQIAQMPPAQAARSIGIIEALLSIQGMQPQAPAPTSAKPPPAPIKPLGAQQASGKPTIQNYRTYAEFVAIREAEEAGRVKR